MLFRVGPGNSGYNFQPEYTYQDGVITLLAGATLATGQAVMRDVTTFPSTLGADMLVLPSSANAGPVYGVYQGNPITNTSAVAQTYPIEALVRGWGKVLCNAPTVAVTVGGAIGVAPPALQATDTATPAALGLFIGFAMATGGVTAKGATIIAIAGAAALVNVAIDI